MLIQKEGYHTYYVYIITNKNRTTLYIGVTNNLKRRLLEHSNNIQKRKTFAARYNCKHLLYYEKFTWIQKAIAREKELKGWRREKKMNLIRGFNPTLAFLEHSFLDP